ncbi:MAG: glycosyltransferase [Candidatus Glassbacteria bacterium]|nr:glycosyltransferase [Candidatus Glassbacteria bacterium]
MDDPAAQNTDPTVTVLMSVYNGQRFLAESIESILGQSFGGFEFLVVDDGSTDSSNAIIQEFARADQRIRILRNETNLGLTRSLNRGIAEARGRYLARQDADDVSLPERLECQTDFLESNPEVGVLGSGCLLIDEAGEVVGERTPVPDSRRLRTELIVKNHALVHTSVMVRTNLLRNAGGYDETIRYAQDYDLWWRLSGRTELANLERKLVKWRVSGAQISAGDRAGQLECMLETSTGIIGSLLGENALPAEPYRRFWLACNSDALEDLRPGDIDLLKPLWDLLSSDKGCPPATIGSIEQLVYRLIRSRGYGAALRLSGILKSYFNNPLRLTSVAASILRSFLPRA